MRLEYKYVVPMSLLDNLRNEILPFVDLDPFALKSEANEYTVRSIYFDTHSFDDYFDKVEGIRNRKKVRIRGYDSETIKSLVFLEIKRKIENWIKKNRFSVSYSNLEDVLVSGNYEDFLTKRNQEVVTSAKNFFYYLLGKSLRPVILVVYEREAFFSKFDNDFRISFDKKIRSSVYPTIDNLYSEDELMVNTSSNFVMELKFSHNFPVWMKEIILKYSLKRVAFSKYVECLEQHKIVDPMLKKRFFGSPLPSSKRFHLID